MIVKRSPARADGGSSFKQLANYINDQKHGGEKVVYQRVTNTENADPRWAIHEIEATQSQNTRAKSDRNYHLIVSFPEGERPTPAQLADIEDQLAKAIGLGDHQRISAAHNDTDNYHLHIAINKIHPKTHNLVEPYYDHYRLGETAQQLEITHKLARDNHALPGQTNDRKAIRADEMRAGGLQPFADWLAEKAQPERLLAGAKSWDQVHKHLAGLGVQIQPKGAGFAFVDDSTGLAVKASAVSRQFSKKRLESELGTYQAPSPASKAPVKERYRPDAALLSTRERAELWAKYNKERSGQKALYKSAKAELAAERRQAIAKFNKEHRKKRLEVKQNRSVAVKGKKRGLYSILKLERLQALERINRHYGDQRQALVEAHRQPDWRDWLAQQAESGNTQALALLRSAQRPSGRGNHVKATDPKAAEQSNSDLFSRYQHHIHRDGKVSYRLKDGGFTDEGKRIALGKTPNDKTIEAALKMARQKYGKTLTVGGNAEFQARAAQIADTLGITIAAAQRRDKPAQAPRPKVNQTAQSGIATYIAERNNKRSQFSDIMEHRPFEKSDAGQLTFNGLRNFSDTRAALFRKNDTVLVMPITEAQHKKLKGFKTGQTLTLDERGRIHTKKLSR